MSTIIVVSLLVSVMRDQVQQLKQFGVACNLQQSEHYGCEILNATNDNKGQTK